MSEKIYEEAWVYTMKVLHDSYKTKNKEDEFKLWFNINYVEDTIDTITVSVASSFLKQTMQKKGNFDIVLNKLKEITGQNDIKLNVIVKEEKISKDTDATASEEAETKSKDNSDSSKEKNSDIKKTSLKKHPLLQEEYTFDTFIPGDNSRFAYNAAIAVAN